MLRLWIYMSSVCFRWKYSFSQHQPSNKAQQQWNLTPLQKCMFIQCKQNWFLHDPVIFWCSKLDTKHHYLHTCIAMKSKSHVSVFALFDTNTNTHRSIPARGPLHSKSIVCHSMQSVQLNEIENSSRKILKLFLCPVEGSYCSHCGTHTHTDRGEPFIAILRFCAIHFKWKPRLIISA